MLFSWYSLLPLQIRFVIFAMLFATPQIERC